MNNIQVILLGKKPILFVQQFLHHERYPIFEKTKATKDECLSIHISVLYGSTSEGIMIKM
jgi:hypothetical protein